MKYFVTAIAVVLMSFATAECDAQGKKEGKRAVQGNKGEGAQRRKGQGQRSPKERVKRILQQFDKDGDEKLDEQELIAMFVAMQSRDRRQGKAGGNRTGKGPSGKRPSGKGDRPGKGKGKGKGKKGKTKTEDSSEFTPKRPGK